VSWAYAEARSVLKGCGVQVPDKCKAMADAAHSQLTYYAPAHVDASNAAIEEALANFNGGANLGGPLPSTDELPPLKE